MSLIRCTLLVLLGAGLARADVLVVPTPAHPTVQAAVDAAQGGDTVLVRLSATIVLEGFTIDGKSLTVIGDAQFVPIEGQIRVRNIAAHQSVLVARLRPTPVAPAEPWDPLTGHALIVEDTLGPVRFAECTFTGTDATYWDTGIGGEEGSDAAVLDENADVAFVRCTFLGGDGASGIPQSATCGCIFGVTGGHGLRSQSTWLSLSDCVLVGGEGSEGNPYGGPGGQGLQALADGLVSGSGSTFVGGHGGFGWDEGSFPQQGGPGGNGLVSEPVAQLLGGEFEGGLGGGSDFGPDGPPGTAFVGQVTLLPGTARSFAMASPVREGQLAYTLVEGEPNDLVVLAIALDTGRLPLPHFSGILFTGLPLLSLGVATVLPASGVLATGVAMPDLPPGEESATFWLQAILSSNGVDAFLSSWTALVLLDGTL